MPSRYNLESFLLERAGTHWANIKRDALAVEGVPNASLTPVLVRGARAAELSLADPYDVTDADLAGLAAASLTTFEKAAELAMLETIVQNWDMASGNLGGSSRDDLEIARWLLLQQIKDLRADLALVGAGGTVTPGEATPTVGLSAGWILGPGRSDCAEF